MTKNIKYNAHDLDTLQYVSQHIAMAVSRSRYEQHLVKVHQELEHRVDDRTQELLLAKENLEDQIAKRKHTDGIQRALYEIAELTNIEGNLAKTYEDIHQIISQYMYAENIIISESARQW